MVWRKDDPQGNESGKVKWEIVRWTRGRGLDVGCGIQKTFPHFIGVDSCKDTELFGHPIRPDVRCETAARLPMFASGGMDFVFSSHLLEHFPLTVHDPRKQDRVVRALSDWVHLERFTALNALTEWMRVIRRGGYLVLYLPDEAEYPKVGEDGANPDHCWNVSYDKVIELMRQVRCGWDLIDFQKRNQDNEYSLYFVFQKVGSGCHESWRTRQKPAKTCGLVRYGAFGDLLQASSVIAGLKEQGYAVTVYTSPPGDEVIRHDPNVHDFYLQDKDQVPNHALAEFWSYQAKKHDKWVNLSESVEMSLLSVPGRTPHAWSPAARHRYMNHNYVEMQHAIASVPHVPRVRFFPTPTEEEWARAERKKLGGDPLIMWALAGSSVHKTWGGLDPTIASILVAFPKAHVLLVGGEDCVILEQGWEREPRVHCRSGAYGIRQTLSLVHEVDMLIGPETGVMNAAAQLPAPKIVFLSHSTHENLTRDWTNTYAVASLETSCPGRGANEAPACHQMHYGWAHCQQFRREGSPHDGTAQCQADIDGEATWELIARAIASIKPRHLVHVA